MKQSYINIDKTTANDIKRTKITNEKNDELIDIARNEKI